MIGAIIKLLADKLPVAQLVGDGFIPSRIWSGINPEIEPLADKLPVAQPVGDGFIPSRIWSGINPDTTASPACVIRLENQRREWGPSHLSRG